MNTIQVKYFGLLKEITGKAEEQRLVAVGLSVGEFVTSLEKDYPGLTAHLFNVAMDLDVVKSEDIIEQAQEIALLPAYAGG